MIKEKELDRTFYEIQVKGYLDARWNELFEGMTIAWKNNVTTISGMVADQAARTVCSRACVITASC